MNSAVLKAIYIPLWLDLLFLLFNFDSSFFINLHSTMVRFIIILLYKDIIY